MREPSVRCFRQGLDHRVVKGQRVLLPTVARHGAEDPGVGGQIELLAQCRLLVCISGRSESLAVDPGAGVPLPILWDAEEFTRVVGFTPRGVQRNPAAGQQAFDRLEEAFAQARRPVHLIVGVRCVDDRRANSRPGQQPREHAGF